MNILRRIPLPTSAVALALASLGNLLAAHSPLLRVACGMLSGLLVLLVLARLVLDPDGLRAELGTPAALAVLPTLPMALMLLSTYVLPLVGRPAAFGLWALALCGQLGLTAVFAKRYVWSFDSAHVLPSWFVVFVGFVVASVTSPAFGMIALGRALLVAGLVGYVATFAAVSFRVFVRRDVPAPVLPSVAIYAAPPSLCLVGYLAVADKPALVPVGMLLAVSAASLLAVLLFMPRILATRFHPGFAAVTFPLVISAIAIKQGGGFLAKAGLGVPALAPAALVAEAVAVAAVLGVLAGLARHVAVAVD